MNIRDLGRTFTATIRPDIGKIGMLTAGEQVTFSTTDVDKPYTVRIDGKNPFDLDCRRFLLFGEDDDMHQEEMADLTSRIGREIQTVAEQKEAERKRNKKGPGARSTLNQPALAR